MTSSTSSRVLAGVNVRPEIAARFPGKNMKNAAMPTQVGFSLTLCVACERYIVSLGKRTASVNAILNAPVSVRGTALLVGVTTARATKDLRQGYKTSVLMRTIADQFISFSGVVK